MFQSDVCCKLQLVILYTNYNTIPIPTPIPPNAVAAAAEDKFCDFGTSFIRRGKGKKYQDLVHPKMKLFFHIVISALYSLIEFDSPPLSLVENADNSRHSNLRILLIVVIAT